MLIFARREENIFALRIYRDRPFHRWVDAAMITERAGLIEGVGVGFAGIQQTARRPGTLIGRHGVSDAVIVRPNDGHPLIDRDRSGVERKIADGNIALGRSVNRWTSIAVCGVDGRRRALRRTAGAEKRDRHAGNDQ